MKAKLIGYWVCTGLIALAMLSGGIFGVMRSPEAVAGQQALGYPLHFVVLLGVWKILGAIAILAPGFPRLKEWAYAGIFIDLSGAVVATWAMAGFGWHVLAPVLVIVFLVGSWALRPDSRKLAGPSV